MQAIKIKLIAFLYALLIFATSCSDSSTGPETSNEIEVDIRMEVQVLDSTYHLYSRPFTQIYFTTYKVDDDRIISEILRSDTTACPNGWGVKELKYTVGIGDTIILGSACEKYNGPNYREIKISYPEIERRIDTLNHATLVKTFAVYYK